MKITAILMISAGGLALAQCPLIDGHPLIQSHDLDGDDRVSLDEFTQTVIHHFNTIDTNSDGLVDQQDLTQLARLTIASHMSQMADEDSDHLTSQVEWNRWSDTWEIDSEGFLILPFADQEGQSACAMTLIDTNQDGGISRVELQSLFTELDSDEDTVISANELREWRHEFGPRHGRTPNTIDLRTADVDANHQLSREEWTLFMERHMDENGLVDLAALCPPPSSPATHHRMGPPCMLAPADTNSDGAISLVESLTFFDQLDTNHDAILTTNELHPQSRRHPPRRRH